MLEMLRLYGAGAVDAVVLVWTHCSATSCVDLQLQSLIDLDHSMSSPEFTARTAVVASRARAPPVTSRQTPAQKICSLGFALGHGLLLPFSHAWNETIQDLFVCGNVFLLGLDGVWLQVDSADPTSGWERSEFMLTGAEYGVGCEDTYGSLFFHVRKQLLSFLAVASRCRITFTMTQQDSTTLMADLPRQLRFDAVYTSNTSDTNYLGPESLLRDWGPLLKPHGTLCMLFMQWFAETDASESTIITALASNEHECWASVTASLRNRHFGERVSLGPNSFSYCKETAGRFNAWLQSTGAPAVAAQLGLHARTRHLCVPPRVFVPLDAPSQPCTHVWRTLGIISQR